MVKLVKIRKKGQCSPCDFVEQMFKAEGIVPDEELSFEEPGVDERIDNLLEQLGAMKVPVVLALREDDVVLIGAVGMNPDAIMEVVEFCNELK